MLKEAERILSVIFGLTQEGEHYWEEVATFPDLIKDRDVKQFTHWHYSKLPVNVTDHEVDYEFPRNIPWALKEAVKTLTFVPKEGSPEPLLKKSMFLRWIMHLVGDIYQLLPTSTRYSDKFQNGDYVSKTTIQ